MRLVLLQTFHPILRLLMSLILNVPCVMLPSTCIVSSDEVASPLTGYILCRFFDGAYCEMTAGGKSVEKVEKPLMTEELALGIIQPLGTHRD